MKKKNESEPIEAIGPRFDEEIKVSDFEERETDLSVIKLVPIS